MSESSQIPDELQPEIGPPAHDPYAALKVAGFRWYLAGWVLSVIGQQLQSVAVGWEIFQRTHRTLLLGWVGLVQALPVMVLALPAGQLADWANRKLILATMQLISAACSVGLAVIAWQHGSIFSIYVLLTAAATCTALSGPARSALLPQIVTADKFANAVSWYSSFFQVAAVTGPAIGGLIIWHSTWPAFVLDALCAATFGLMVASIPLRSPPSQREPPSLASLAAGIRFVWRTKIILATITLDLFAVLLGGATFLLPAVATDLLHVGSFGFGCLRASFAVGALTMAMLNAHLPPMKRAGRGMLWAVAGFGAATIVFGLSRNYWLSMTMLFFAGGFDNISVLVRHTLVQVLTPDEMRGRVSAVNNVFINASNELGGLESGVTAAAFGLVTSIVGGGIGTVVVVVLTAMIWPEVRRFGSLRDAAASTFEEKAPGVITGG
jgi:MFS family permease